MYTLTTLSLIVGAYALTVPRSSCSFGLTASGGESGTIGQLSDGQNRIGGGLSAATFTINNGGITDAAGRGCILTPSVEQFQCDQGVGPTYGFAIESNGTLTSSGSSVFYACPASDVEWNLYTTPVIGQLKCVEISLTASGCGAEASSAAIQSITTVTVYNCGLASSTAPAVIYSSTSSPQGTVETSAPVRSTTTNVVPVVTTSQVAIPSSESAPGISSISLTTLEVSSAETTSTLVQVSTPVSVIETSSLATVVPSSVATLSTSYHPHSVISPSSVLETPTSSIIVSPVTSVVSETSVSPNTTIITSVASTTKVYPTTAPYGNITVTSSSYIASSVASSTISSVSSASNCVATTLTGSDTSGNYQYPHLIIPISSTSPDTAYGTQYFATISSNTSTIFNFDIPSSYSGSTCNLIFLLPLHSELETSSYTSSGSGEIEFEQLSSAATSATTYDNAPSVESVLGDFTITEGSSTLIESFECPVGETLTYELKALQDTYLYYFQDWNPSPIGLFITYC